MTVLRELVAKVVLRMDDTTWKRLDVQLNQAKRKLDEIRAAGTEGVKVNVDMTEAERALVGLRISLREIGDNITPEIADNLRGQLDAGKAKAEEVRAAIDKLRYIGNADEEIKKLEGELASLEREARETAAALKPIEDAFKRANDEAKKLAEEGAKRAAAETKRLAEEAKKLTGIFGKIQENWGKLGTGLQTLGVGLGVAGLVAFVHQTIEAAGAVEDFADRLGVTTNEAQVWSAFAKQAGTDNEALSASFKGLANAMQGAANGGKEQKAAFETLGISTDKWKKGLPSLTDTLALVGGRLGELDNEGQRLALTQKLLSEGGLKLAPAFKGGTAAVQEQLEKLKELAVVYDEEFVKSAGEAGDELDMFYSQFRGLGSELILTFMPALRTTVQTLTPFIRGIREAFKNSSIFKGILAATGITALASFGGISGVLARIGPMLSRLAVMAAPFIWAFAKFALLALIIDDLWVALNGGKSVIGHVLGKFAAGRATLEAMQATFKVLKGSVMLLWGALSGDQESIDQGKALIDEFSVWADSAFFDIQDSWNQFWSETFPGMVDGGLDESGVSIERSLDDWYTLIGNWAGKTGKILSEVWDGAIDGLLELVRLAGNLLAMIPGLDSIGSDAPDREYSDWEPISPSAKRAKAEMDRARNAAVYGTESNPYLPGGSALPPVTVNNEYSFETNINGNSSKEVVAAVQRTERTQTTAIKDNRKTLRHAVGATR